MKYQITGTLLPILEVGLEPGDALISASGELGWMTPNIRMRTVTLTAGATGLWDTFSRAVSGGGLFMTEYIAELRAGGIAFAPQVPGQIVPVTVRDGQGFMIHRDGFLCATPGVQLSTSLQKSLGAGIFGGDGFVLQHLAGDCQAWISLGGEVVANVLQPGETLLVNPGHVGMFEDSVQFQVVAVDGIRNALFGVGNLFLVQLTGPGRIWLQTMTVPHLAHALEKYMAKK